MSEYIIGMTAEVIERAKNGETIRITPKLQEIVRCRGCVRFYEGEPECGTDDWCSEFSCQIEPDGFCAWGKRREQ